MPQFWTACRESKVRDWRSGDFEISVDGRFTVRAEGVLFYLSDLKALFPKAFALQAKRANRPPSPEPELAPSVNVAAAKGGRKLSPSWPQWVAEVVAHIHENGIPEGEGASGVDVMLKNVSDRLAEQGLEGPARTTSQETMRAILLRMRGAGN